MKAQTQRGHSLRDAKKALEVRYLPGPILRGVRDLNPWPILGGSGNRSDSGHFNNLADQLFSGSASQRSFCAEHRADVNPVLSRAGATDLGAPNGGEAFQRLCRLRQMAGVA
jgi:hypothetical protein